MIVSHQTELQGSRWEQKNQQCPWVFFPSEESWGLRGFDQLCFLGSMCFFQDFWFLVWMISLLCFFRLPLLRNKHKFHGRSAASTSEGFQASLKALKIYSSRKFREEKRLIPAEKGAVFKRCQWILIRCAFFFWEVCVFFSKKDRSREVGACKNRWHKRHVATLRKKRIAAMTS